MILRSRWVGCWLPCPQIHSSGFENTFYLEDECGLLMWHRFWMSWFEPVVVPCWDPQTFPDTRSLSGFGSYESMSCCPVTRYGEMRRVDLQWGGNWNTVVLITMWTTVAVSTFVIPPSFLLPFCVACLTFSSVHAQYAHPYCPPPCEHICIPWT